VAKEGRMATRGKNRFSGVLILETEFGLFRVITLGKCPDIALITRKENIEGYLLQ
jgi:hypothetical protein